LYILLVIGEDGIIVWILLDLRQRM
jgi:hypothetical protein